MDLTKLQQTIGVGASNTLELKRSTAKLKGAAETLCGFLNGQGGMVLIGVNDNKGLIGQEVTDNTRQEIANTLKKFEPSTNISVEYVTTAGDKMTIILTAHPDSRCVPYTFNRCAYERKESTTHLMTQGRYQQLLLSRSLNPSSWESQPAIGVTIDDLDADEIIRILKEGG